MVKSTFYVLLSSVLYQIKHEISYYDSERMTKWRRAALNSSNEN